MHVAFGCVFASGHGAFTGGRIARGCAHFNMMDYPRLTVNYDRAAEEVDRSTGIGKIHWYADSDVPPDLDICPSNLIVRSDRLRVVHDWSRAGMNGCLEVPGV